MKSSYYTCKGCAERYPGCHDHCEKYAAEYAAYLKDKAKRDEYMAPIREMMGYSKAKFNKIYHDKALQSHSVRTQKK